MKWLIALVALLSVGAVVAIAVAVHGTRDPVPGRLRNCVEDAQLTVAHSRTDLGAVRVDVADGTLRTDRRFRIGGDDGRILAGTRARVLVLAGRRSPPLAGDLARRLLDRTGEYALVAVETDPVRGALADCVRIAAHG